MALAQYTLGDESMLKTLEGLGYPGPALLVMREMLPTPLDMELDVINTALRTWGRSVNNRHVAEFKAHRGKARDIRLAAVRYKLEFDGYEMKLFVGWRAFDSYFETPYTNMCNNVLDWQELGSMLFELEGTELQMVQMKRFQYRNILDYCFKSPGQCQLCYGKNQQFDSAICEDCEHERQPKECQICHQTKGRTVPSKFTYYGSIEDPTCECRAHTVCWLTKFHEKEMGLERMCCEMCGKRAAIDSDSEEEYYDAIEEVEEPSSKRRRLE